MGNAVFAVTTPWLMGGITSYPRRDFRVCLEYGLLFVDVSLCWPAPFLLRGGNLKYGANRRYATSNQEEPALLGNPFGLL
ncbi:uncharacterized protein EV154DRAFT_565262 [Mucor mucedo]|uniref:uncharacterized protein n=1 Tax=Mucor mucedo TaxID=29922 RepID=UPI00221EC779|nr:uncharacterized protein EV154DRAFT_565262 [Mucor mucedo]KAI7889570.1 hypothetical protein EV154DRAFT_565262 [Mucor mucedo]